MRLLSVTTIEHNVFGSQTFDFANEEGNPESTIIIVGENGSGKTKLLDVIFELSKISTYEIKNQQVGYTYAGKYKIKLEDDFSITRIRSLEYPDIRNEKTVLKPFEFFTGILELEIVQQYSSNAVIGLTMELSIDGKFENFVWPNKETSWWKGFKIESVWSPHIKMLYSSAETKYMPEEARSITTSKINDINLNNEKTNDKFSTEINQLLVNINSDDALDLQKWVSENQGIAPPENVQFIRTKRFNNAFSFMFSDLKIKTVEKRGDLQYVIFSKDGRDVELSKLSSGERNVIFRGALLVKNYNALDDSIIIIDEPELSLHPQWQKNILSYFKQMLSNESGKKTSQLFVATHSQFIVQGDNRYSDKVLVLKNRNGNIQVDYDGEFATIGSVEKIYKALNVEETFLGNNTTTIYVEGKTDVKYWNKAKELFSSRSSEYNFKGIGEESKKGSKNGGDTFLKTGYDFLSVHQPPKPAIFLFDCDSTNYRELNQGHVYNLKLQQEQYSFTSGIENLLNLAMFDVEKDFESYYEEYTKTIDLGIGKKKEIVDWELKKDDFCDFLITHKDIKKILTNFEKHLKEFEKKLL